MARTYVGCLVLPDGTGAGAAPVTAPAAVSRDQLSRDPVAIRSVVGVAVVVLVVVVLVVVFVAGDTVMAARAFTSPKPKNPFRNSVPKQFAVRCLQAGRSVHDGRRGWADRPAASRCGAGSNEPHAVTLQGESSPRRSFPNQL